MAIYHLSASIVKRSAGRSVTAAAAYRAASKIEDITTGIVHDYSRKQGVDYSEIISPISASVDNEWLLDREKLWNKIELIEKRKDAQLAREITIAIPVELDRASKIELVREYVKGNFVDQGMVADINIHHIDGNNPHAHVLLTMRNLQTNPEGNIEFGLKNTNWNSKDLLLSQRQNWEEITNKYLAAAGSEAKIDCRSLKDQGSPYIPQIHLGVHATAMKRKGIATDRSEEYDRIEAENNDIRARLEEIYQQEYTDLGLNVKQLDDNNKTIEDEERELGELVNEMIPLEFKKYLNFAGYRLHRIDENRTEVYLTSKLNLSEFERYDGWKTDIGNKSKILELKRENDKWIKNIPTIKNQDGAGFPRIWLNHSQGIYKKTHPYCCPEYVNELVNNFEKCVRYPTELQTQKFQLEVKTKLNPEPPEPSEFTLNQIKLFEEEIKEARRLKDILNDSHKKYSNARYATYLKAEDYTCILRLGDNHKYQNDRLKKDLTIKGIYKDAVYDTDPDVYYRYTILLPRAGDAISNTTTKIHIRRSYKCLDDNYFKRYPNERLATSEDKYLIFQRDMDKLSTRTLWMENILKEIEYEIIKIKAYNEIELNRQKAEAAEKAAAIKIESLAPIRQAQVTRLRPPDRKPIRSGDVLSRITLISQNLANQSEQKLEEPETIESKPVTKPETIESKPAIQEAEAIESKLAAEDLRADSAITDPITKEEPPIKVVKINQPTIKKTAKTRTRRPDRGGIG